MPTYVNPDNPADRVHIDVNRQGQPLSPTAVTPGLQSHFSWDARYHGTPERRGGTSSSAMAREQAMLRQESVRNKKKRKGGFARRLKRLFRDDRSEDQPTSVPSITVTRAEVSPPPPPAASPVRRRTWSQTPPPLTTSPTHGQTRPGRYTLPNLDPGWVERDSPRPNTASPSASYRPSVLPPRFWRGSGSPSRLFPEDRCQLNPYLAHIVFGRPPIDFNISESTDNIYFAEPRDIMIPFDSANRVQFATFPPLDRLIISAVADDPVDNWPWPTYVNNSHGVTVQDVFQAIYECFQQPMTRTEYEGEMCSSQRREMIKMAYYTRTSSDTGAEPKGLGLIFDEAGSSRTEQEEGARRIDYMAGRTQFRGLEPHPDKDGSWVLYLGPP